jgi:hypothetical protein
MTSPRSLHTATRLLNGKVILVGGTDGSQVLATAEIFDPATNKFTSTGDLMSTSRESQTATLLNSGQVLVAGGDNGAVALASAEITPAVIGATSTTTTTATSGTTGRIAIPARKR